MGVYRQVEKRFFSPPSGAGDPWAIPSNGSLAAITNAGVQVTDDTAMQLISVMACVRILSSAVADLPLNAVRTDAGGLSIISTPAPPIIADPFGGLSNPGLLRRRDGMVQMMVSLLLRGNAYLAVISTDSVGRPTRLRVLHPDRVKCEFDGDGNRAYKINNKTVDTSSIVHIMGISYPECPTGLSPISYARNAVGLGLAAEQFGSQFFSKGAHMTGYVTVPGDLDIEKARGLKENFESGHAGLAKSHTVGVLSGGAEWKPISVSPEDAQFLQTRGMQISEIAMLFGVPPHMLGQTDKSTSWGTGIEQQSLGFLQYTLKDWIGRIEDAWSSLMAKPLNARYDVDSMLRTDAAGRYAVYGAARTAGLMTQNEIRALENLPPVDGGDDIAAGLNSTASPLKDAGAKTSMTADALGQVL